MNVVRLSPAPRLTDEQQRLVRDPDALLMVERLAKRLRRRFGNVLPYKELSPRGHLGLAKAALTYNLQEGVTFATFARKFVRGQMFNGIRDQLEFQNAACESLDRFVDKLRDEAGTHHDNTEEAHLGRLHDTADGAMAAISVGLAGGILRGGGAAGDGEAVVTARRLMDAVLTELEGLDDPMRMIVRQHQLEAVPLKELVGQPGVPNYMAARRQHVEGLKKLGIRMRARGFSGE
jgi:DNA-directed RNA polymerase specialized sigma subunit